MTDFEKNEIIKEKLTWDVYEMSEFEYYRFKKEDAERMQLRKVEEDEYLDISYLVDDKFVSFFTDPNSNCKGTSTGYLGSWNYPEIMKDFQWKVVYAYHATVNFLTYHKPIWAIMREKYFNGEPYVQPEEMIKYKDSFDNREIIAFLDFCANYSELYNDGIYGAYAKEGLIGIMLLELKKRPLKLSFD